MLVSFHMQIITTYPLFEMNASKPFWDSSFFPMGCGAVVDWGSIPGRITPTT